ncbi:hypothetical protein BGY98DRAFT_1100826 [Russula aff. rugulosa BPL654]|nr:hypothetical protein BGY98DRAFT_1100826 [Russula aff. rugulosa BPL654]
MSFLGRSSASSSTSSFKFFSSSHKPDPDREDPVWDEQEAKPAVEVNTVAVDVQVTGMPEAVITAGRVLHELEGMSVLVQSPPIWQHRGS